MSGQNTPISIKSDSSVSLEPPTVSVDVTINADIPGLIPLLVGYFTGAKLFARISRTSRTGPRITKVTIQGHPMQFPSSLEYLKGLLRIKYDAAIVWGELSNVPEGSRYESVTIEETEPQLKRDPSSGEFMEHHFEEISWGGSASTEAVKKIAKETFASMAKTATGFGIAKGWIPAFKKEHISVKRGDERYSLEISSISSLPELIEAVEKKFNSSQPIKSLYTMEDGDVVVVTDVKDLREGWLYYALAGFQELPKKQAPTFSPEMEMFLERLESTLKDPNKKERQIRQIRQVFDAQDIDYDQLMAAGDLALTDEKLKDYGIAQGGLRTSILSVIKSN